MSLPGCAGTGGNSQSRSNRARDSPTVVPPLILHVLPVDLSRGAQTYARDLRGLLDGRDAQHRTVTIFRSAGDTLAADYRLDVPDGRLRRLGADLRGVLRLRRLCRDLAPAVVVAHGGEPLKYAVLAGIPRSRLAYYKIGIGSDRLRGQRRRLHRAMCRRAGAVAAVSESVAQEARSLGVAADRLRVIPNGRDVERYGSSVRAEREHGSVRLGFVGHLTASKRPERFVEVVRALRSEGRAVEGIVAGAGPRLEAVTSSVRDLPIQVLGAVDDVPAY